MTRRRLRPDELELWRKVTETTERMHPNRPLAAKPMPAEKKKPKQQSRQRLEQFQLGQKARPAHPKNEVLPGLSESLASKPVHMDKKAFSRLKRGKMKPEGKIDLHGMTMEQAHSALSRFILRSSAKGKRLVLVITGKGKSTADEGPIPMRTGVLRHNVPQWLSLPPLAQVVLQVSEAHLKHGGGGAYYVYLRRVR